MELSKKALLIKQSKTLQIAAKAKKMKAEGIDIVSFSAGEPDFNTPDCANEAAISAINNGFTKYTESSGILELREAICQKLLKDNNLSYKPNQIVVSSGAKQSLHNIFTAILNEGDEIIILAPFWLSYPEMIRLAGGIPVFIYTDAKSNYIPTKQQLEDAVSSKTKAIIINSPCNPTGTVFGKEDLEMIAEFAVKNNIFIISDEIYEKLIYGEGLSHISIASLNEEIFNRTIVVNGMSKAFSMTGWRVGYTASNSEIAAVMSNIQSHCASNPNSIAQKAALAALKDSEQFIENMDKEYLKRRNYIYERVVQIPHISAIKPAGTFYVFVDISSLCRQNKTICGVEVTDAKSLGEVLISNYSVAVVPCDDFGYNKHIRLSFAVSMDCIKKGMDRIEKFVVENYS